MHGASLGEVAEKYLRPRVELVGDDVQVAVPIQVEQDRGAAGTRGHHGQFPGGVKSTPRFDTARLLDRKSTRLNSSHSQISYAVFCLKKKKIGQTDGNVSTLIAIPSIKHNRLYA